MARALSLSLAVIGLFASSQSASAQQYPYPYYYGAGPGYAPDKPPPPSAYYGQPPGYPPQPTYEAPRPQPSYAPPPASNPDIPPPYRASDHFNQPAPVPPAYGSPAPVPVPHATPPSPSVAPPAPNAAPPPYVAPPSTPAPPPMLTPGSPSAQAALDTQYRALQSRDPNAFASVFASDAFVFGPLAEDAYAGNVSMFAQRFATRGATSVQSRGVQMRQAGGTCAWAFDEVEVGNGGNPLRYHVTSLIDGSGGQWRVVAQSWSVPVRPTYALAMSNRNGWAELAPIQHSVGIGAEGAHQIVQRWLTSKQFEPIRGRRDTLLINAWPDDNREGDAAITEALNDIREDETFLVRPAGGQHARTVCGGQMAYVAFNQDVTIGAGSVGGNSVNLKTRGMAFFERERNRYRPVLLEVSVGHPDYPG